MDAAFFGPGQTKKAQNFSSKGVAPTIQTFDIADTAANTATTGISLFSVPTGWEWTPLGIGIIPDGSASGVDANNPVAMALVYGNNTSIGSYTFNTAHAFPADDTFGSWGSIVETPVPADSVVKLNVTNGVTANPPAFKLQLFGSLDKV